MIMKTDFETEHHETPPSVEQLSHFLSDYGAWLMGVGATCIRLEKNLGRIARAYGKDVEVSIMPRHLHLEVSDRNDMSPALTSIAPIPHTPVSFNINTGLSRLSWEIADGRISFGQARQKFREIISDDYQSRWLVLILVTLANASFCRLFGGDFVAMGIVAVATFAGYYLKQILLSKKTDIRLVMLLCAFGSAVIGATGALFGLGATPYTALGTSVLYLVPGIPFLNSFSDLIYRHYLCALSRFMDAVVLTCCLSAGLCAAMLLMRTGMF